MLIALGSNDIKHLDYCSICNFVLQKYPSSSWVGGGGFLFHCSHQIGCLSIWAVLAVIWVVSIGPSFGKEEA